MAAGIVSLAVAAATLAITRPPELASGARAAAAAISPSSGAVLSDWRWAGQLQRDLGAGRHVLAAGGLGSESSDFWLDYVRLIQGHERWSEELQQLNVDLLVLNSEQRPIANLVRTSADWHVMYDADNALVAERAVR